MGVTLSLFVNDESIESPYISRAFLDEIINNSFSYIPFDKFLSKDEIKILQPNSEGEIIIGERKPMSPKKRGMVLKDLLSYITNNSGSTNNGFAGINKLLNEYVIKSEKIEDRERDPEFLKRTVLKVEYHLNQFAANFPLVHTVYSDRNFIEENIVGFIEIDGVKGFFEGDLFHNDNYEELRNQIHVRSYWDDTGKIDFYIKVEPEIKINGEAFYVKSITKAEQFKDEFQKVYTFLDQAIKSNKKVLWEFG